MFNTDVLLENLSAKAAKANPPAPDDSFDDEGFRICPVCKKRKQRPIVVEGKRKIVPCACACVENQAKQEKEREQRSKRFRDANSRPIYQRLHNRRIDASTFANHDGSNPRARALAERFVQHWDEMKEKGCWLNLWGACGTGKTYLASCIVNALQEQEIPALMTGTARLLSYITSRDDKGIEAVSSLSQFDLLVLDDFGAERQTPMMLEQLKIVVDARLESRLPLIITSNIDPNQFYQSHDGLERLYDRMKGCIGIELKGASKREGLAAQQLKDMSRILGIAELDAEHPDWVHQA